jgi:hypothetical protein
MIYRKRVCGMWQSLLAALATGKLDTCKTAYQLSQRLGAVVGKMRCPVHHGSATVSDSCRSSVSVAPATGDKMQ